MLNFPNKPDNYIFGGLFIALLLALSLPFFVPVFDVKPIPLSEIKEERVSPPVASSEEIIDTAKEVSKVETPPSFERLGQIKVSHFLGFSVEHLAGQCDNTKINYLQFKKESSFISFSLYSLNPMPCLSTDNFTDPQGIGRSGDYFYDRETGNFYNDYGAGKLPISGQSVVIDGKSRILYPLKYTDHEGYFLPLAEYNQSIVISLSKDPTGKSKPPSIYEVLKNISIQ